MTCDFLHVFSSSEFRGGGAEQNRTKVLGLSASLLAGGAVWFPKLLPGPGQHAISEKQRDVPPLYWMACKSSILCNAGCLGLTFRLILRPKVSISGKPEIRPHV